MEAVNARPFSLEYRAACRASGPPLATSVEAAAYFTDSEALTNVARHAHATRA